VRLAPKIKSPRARQRFSWFVERYCQHGSEAARLMQLADGNAQLKRFVSEELTALSSRAISYQGYAWTCETCNHANFLTADRLSPLLSCAVCGQDHALAASFESRFLLDEAIARGMRERGLRSVVWALGILQASAHHSFFFSPPLDLFIKGCASPTSTLHASSTADSSSASPKTAAAISRARQSIRSSRQLGSFDRMQSSLRVPIRMPSRSRMRRSSTSQRRSTIRASTCGRSRAKFDTPERPRRSSHATSGAIRPCTSRARFRRRRPSLRRPQPRRRNGWGYRARVWALRL